MKSKEMDWITQCMNAAVRYAQAAPDGCLAVGAVVACPLTGKVIAAAHDTSVRNGAKQIVPLGHAVMNVIDEVARQGTWETMLLFCSRCSDAAFCNTFVASLVTFSAP